METYVFTMAITMKVPQKQTKPPPTTKNEKQSWRQRDREKRILKTKDLGFSFQDIKK